MQFSYIAIFPFYNKIKWKLTDASYTVTNLGFHFLPFICSLFLCSVDCNKILVPLGILSKFLINGFQIVKSFNRKILLIFSNVVKTKLKRNKTNTEQINKDKNLLSTPWLFSRSIKERKSRRIRFQRTNQDKVIR